MFWTPVGSRLSCAVALEQALEPLTADPPPLLIDAMSGVGGTAVALRRAFPNVPLWMNDADPELAQLQRAVLYDHWQPSAGLQAVIEAADQAQLRSLQAEVRRRGEAGPLSEPEDLFIAYGWSQGRSRCGSFQPISKRHYRQRAAVNSLQRYATFWAEATPPEEICCCSYELLTPLAPPGALILLDPPVNDPAFDLELCWEELARLNSEETYRLLLLAPSSPPLPPPLARTELPMPTGLSLFTNFSI